MYTTLQLINLDFNSVFYRFMKCSDTVARFFIRKFNIKQQLEYLYS